MKKDKAKDHYKSRFAPQRRLSYINKLTYEYIQELDVQTVFEFGCNVGRHLLHLRKKGLNVWGIDINATNIFEARFINRIETVEVGDELSLEDIPDNSFDLVFTNSVLCHIKKTDKIIEQLKRISSKHLLLCEAVERQGVHWYEHTYPGYVVLEKKSKQGKLYKLFHFEHGRRFL